jgi:glycosyltransferase involved in cell wall biosynthesis
MRVTISMPCYKRPKRTIRAIESIVNQTINGWEALVVGDCCPNMDDFLKSNYFNDLIQQSENNGNILSITNNDTKYGGWGYHITNQNISRAKGKYFVFLDNDDMFLQNHLENYLSGIENTHYDFVYFDTYLHFRGGGRQSDLRYGEIGHSELIIKTDFLRSIPPHSGSYGHDWELVANMMSKTREHAKAYGKPQTYYVMSSPDARETEID